MTLTSELLTPLDEGLTALLGREGRAGLLAFAMDCAHFVLPLYEVRFADDRARQALRPDHTRSDVRLVAEILYRAVLSPDGQLALNALETV